MDGLPGKPKTEKLSTTWKVTGEWNDNLSTIRCKHFVISSPNLM